MKSLVDVERLLGPVKVADPDVDDPDLQGVPIIARDSDGGGQPMQRGV
jgi:hypothetical protein